MNKVIEKQIRVIYDLGVKDLYDVNSVYGFAKALNYPELCNMIKTNIVGYFNYISESKFRKAELL